MIPRYGLLAVRIARIQRGFSDGLFDIMQGKFDNMGDRFKSILDRMVADALAAQLAKEMFGDMDKTGEIGGWVGKGMDWLKGGSSTEWTGGSGSGLLGSIGSFFGFGGGAAAAGASATPLADTAASTGIISPFASGGDFMGGRPILVGEEGPEIITPRASGTVIPNNEIGGRGNVYNIPITINVPGNVTRDTADYIATRVARAAQRVLSRNS